MEGYNQHMQQYQQDEEESDGDYGHEQEESGY